MKRIDFVIEAERTNTVDNHISLYLRDHDDGAVSWTRNPDKARRFDSTFSAVAYAERHTNMGCKVVRL